MSKQMWFGTEERMRWIPAPQTGATMSPQAWSQGGTLLGGGGWQQNSFNSHRHFDFSWSKASLVDDAQIMQAYFNGLYGRGLIWFIDPLAYQRNILPPHWAAPGLALDYEAPPLIRTTGVVPTGFSVSDPANRGWPVTGATYNLTSSPIGYPGPWDSLFVPIPPGYTLMLGAHYSATGGGGVFSTKIEADGSVGLTQRLAPTGDNPFYVTPDLALSGGRGVRLWIGRDSPGAATVSLTAMSGRLFDSLSVIYGVQYGYGEYGEGAYGGEQYPTAAGGTWKPGMGHTGCRFDGPPTYAATGGNFGGQAGYAVSLREVGGWLY
ncbi:hypothetical protein [Microbacterium sp. No. 7]|uniref:hypothetical protein n=1 Tax=Microbacterium sp. No. 7 TaxID=1714373 RepID=UPI0006D0BFBF|nr:hypothetical protein [Microbacterium sp. No. 7]ALJ19577.1 hypothetical protein AOA12_06505 [Microbacterium sp. No. 7]